MEELVRLSYQESYKKELRSVFGQEIQLLSQEVDDCGTENVVRVTVVNSNFEKSLSFAVEKFIGAKLRLDKFGFSGTDVHSQTPSMSEHDDGEKMLSDKLTVLVNDITITMKSRNYATYRGKIYKKDTKGHVYVLV